MQQFLSAASVGVLAFVLSLYLLLLVAILVCEVMDRWDSRKAKRPVVVKPKLWLVK